MTAELHPQEAQRITTLHSLQILDSAASDAWDALAKLASEICDTPVALVSLVDDDRQWFKAKVGLDADQTPRDQAFCAHAILQDGIFTVQDARQDARFRDNPLVTGGPNIRFYAGIPVRAPDGTPMGTVCVIDDEPRILNAQQEEALRQVGHQTEELLRLRSLAQQVDDEGATEPLIERLEANVVNPLTPLFLPLSTIRSQGSDPDRDALLDEIQRNMQTIRDGLRQVVVTEAAK